MGDIVGNQHVHQMLDGVLRKRRGEGHRRDHKQKDNRVRKSMAADVRGHEGKRACRHESGLPR